MKRRSSFWEIAFSCGGVLKKSRFYLTQWIIVLELFYFENTPGTGQGETPASGVKSADQNMEYLADRIVPQNSLGTPASVEISAQITHMSNGLKTQKRDGIHQVPTFF